MVEASERGVALWRLAFRNHCELCDAIQRRHGNADKADDGPLASRARKVETTAVPPYCGYTSMHVEKRRGSHLKSHPTWA